MILTVTPNTGLDHVLFVPELMTGVRQQASHSVESMGGKGCDVSLILRAFDEPTLATGMAGGERGERMQEWLRRAGVETDFVWTPGETRLNTVLIESETLRHTTICAEALLPRPVDARRLLDRLARLAPSAAAVAVCGSLPPGLEPGYYAELVRTARGAGRPVVVDASGDCLLAALEAHPTAVKPNRQELASVSAIEVDGPEAAAAAARTLIDRGTEIVLASLGHEGAVAVRVDECYYIPPLDIRPVNPAGAGDGMVAMLALGLAKGLSFPDIIRRAVAAAAAITTTRGTADCPAVLARELVQSVRLAQVPVS